MYSLITLIIDVTDNIYQLKPYSEMQQENREKPIFQKGLKFSADYRLHKNVTKKKKIAFCIKRTPSRIPYYIHTFTWRMIEIVIELRKYIQN